MRAIILAGGAGRRLYPYTAVLPKPLMPMGDRPIMEILVRQLRAAGFRRLTLATGHMAELIMAVFGTGERFGLCIDYTREERPLGTVGPLRLVEGLTERFLVLNGDLLTDVSFEALVAFHDERRAALTIATFRKPVQLGLGIIHTDDQDLVNGFEEKPTLEYDVSMGIYVFEPRLRAFIPDDRPFGFDQLMAALLAAGERVAVYRHRGAWFDIGSPEDYQRAANEIERRPEVYLPGAGGQ